MWDEDYPVLWSVVALLHDFCAAMATIVDGVCVGSVTVKRPTFLTVVQSFI